MKKSLVSILVGLVGLTLAVLFLANNSGRFAEASGITSQPNQAGDVKVINQDGVIYLSTETNADQNTLNGGSSTNQQSFQISNPLASFIDVPTGFAENITQLISFISRLVLAVASLLVFAFLIWGAFDWITSGGDKGKIEKARGKIISAVIGLIIISASYAILNLALGFLGLDSLEGALNNVGTIQQGPTPTPETDLGALIEATPSATSE